MTLLGVDGTALPDPLPVPALERPFDLRLRPPGSKSVTNRAYVLAALADGVSRVERPLRSDDCDRLLRSLETLGATMTWDGDDVLITGVAGRFPRGGRVDLGDGGTPARFMIAVACLAGAPTIVDGSKRMRERPVAEGVDMLRRLGASIEYAEEEGRLPVRVDPVDDAGALRLRGGALRVPPTRSSQFVSALMLVAPCLARGVRLAFEGPMTSASYVALTTGAMRRFGLAVHDADDRLDVPSQAVVAHDAAVPPDASSAIYWHAAATIIPGATIETPGLSGAADGGQPDEAAIAMLPGAVPGRPGRRRGPDRFEIDDFDAEQFPDGAVALAAIAGRAASPTTITGLHTLRVKECDRVAALTCELRRIGCTVEPTEDTLFIDPRTAHEETVVIETYDDHRMAMAFAVLGLARGALSIADPSCVGKSYPGFWRDLDRLRAPG